MCTLAPCCGLSSLALASAAMSLSASCLELRLTDLTFSMRPLGGFCAGGCHEGLFPSVCCCFCQSLQETEVRSSIIVACHDLNFYRGASCHLSMDPGGLLHLNNAQHPRLT